MPTYKYEALYANGEKVEGVLEAVSKTEAVAQIRQSCEVVLALKEVPKLAKADPLARFQKIGPKSLALSCQQFSIILKAGLPLVQTVELVSGQAGDKALQRLWQQVAEDVANGWSLSYSLEQRGGRLLPVTFYETVRAGEESGDLLAAFSRLSVYFERLNKTRESVVSALTYPSFVMMVAVVVISIIMGYAVPTFTGMFSSMNIELPLVTKALIGLSHFCQHYFLFFGLALVILIASMIGYSLTEQGAQRLARWQLKIPIFGEIVRMSGVSQFAHTMNTLLQAGMPILQAIEVSGRTVSNSCLSEEILGTLSGVESGRSLGECLGYTKELPPMLVQLTAVGEATGSMEDTLKVLAEYYDSEVDLRTKRALALLEPTIIVVLAIFVVFILMAVYLPMFSMYSSI